MKHLLPSLLALAASLLSAAPILVQDFEDTSLFRCGPAQPRQVGLSKELYGNWLGFNGKDFQIVEGSSPRGGRQVLQISRVTPAVNLSGFRTAQLHSDRDTTLRLTFRVGATGKCMFGFQLRNSFQNKTVTQVQLQNDGVAISVVNGHGHFLFRSVPETWLTLVLTVHPGRDKLDAHLLKADGTRIACVAAPMQNNLPFNQIVFYNVPGATAPALIDRIEIGQGDAASVTGRENVALAVSDSKAVLTDAQGKREIPRVIDGELTADSSQVVDGLPAAIHLEFAAPRTVRSLRIHSGIAAYKAYPSGDLSLTACRVEGLSTASGGWRELVHATDSAPAAASADEEDAARFWQFDFAPIEVRALRITLLDSNDTKRRVAGAIQRKQLLLREIEAYADEYGNAAAGLGSVLQAEFRLQVYRGQRQAQLHAILADGTPPLDVELSFRERWTKKVPTAPFRTRLKPGRNVIPIDIGGWENGEYRTLIRAAGAAASAKGEMARLLRIDRIPPAVPPAAFGDLSGKSLFFPDGWYFERHSGLAFGPGRPEVHCLDLPRNAPDAFVRLGSTMYFTADGKLVLSYHEYSYTWKHLGTYYAACTPGEWKWTLLPGKPSGIVLQNNAEIGRHQCQAAAVSLPGASVGAAGRFRLYDPQKDGAVNLRDVVVQYVGYKPLDWGVVKPRPQSTWLIWKKGGENVLLQDHSFLQDGVSGGEFENPTDTNDNHAGQWLSPDGKTLYFARGHLLRRYAPFIDRYDNLWMVSRILTIFSTRDGLHWDRHYFSLPDETDPPNLQHYGASIYWMPRGNGLMLGLMMPYDAHRQLYDVELVWSWNGEEWKRFPGHGRWIANSTTPDTPGFGIINMHNNIVEKDGVIYHEIGWITNVPHFAGDNLYVEGKGGRLTGEDVRKLNERRGVSTDWPFWKHYGSWEKLAEAWNRLTTTCGVAVYRKDGYFMVSAGNAPGAFTTRPLSATGKLAANLHVLPGGKATFALLAPDGRTIAERTLASCDDVALPLFDRLPAGAFRIHAELQNAQLFSLRFE